MEDAHVSPMLARTRISGRQFFSRLATFFGVVILGALGIIGWEFFETQRICTIIEGHEGHVGLPRDSVAFGESYYLNDLRMGRPIFRYQVVDVSVGFRSSGDYVDFSQPLRPGERHPLAVLERLPNLEQVSVSSLRISTEGLACLARCRRLARLNLGARELSAEQMQALAACRTVQQLHIECPSLTGSAIAALESLPALESLAIRESEIDGEGMLALSSLNGLRQLDLDYAKIGQSGLRYLAALPNLETLAIRNIGKTHVDYESLGLLTQLRSLALSQGIWPDGEDDPPIDVQFAELANLTKLNWLWLESLKLTDASIDTLLRFSDLETLDIECTEMTDDGAIRLANGLKLDRLTLGSSKFSDPERICKLVSHPKLYFANFPWSRYGCYITSLKPR